MAKITAWLVTLIGIILLFQTTGIIPDESITVDLIIALSVLLVGVAKLLRNYGKSSKSRK